MGSRPLGDRPAARHAWGDEAGGPHDTAPITSSPESISKDSERVKPSLTARPNAHRLTRANIFISLRVFRDRLLDTHAMACCGTDAPRPHTRLHTRLHSSAPKAVLRCSGDACARQAAIRLARRQPGSLGGRGGAPPRRLFAIADWPFERSTSPRVPRWANGRGDGQTPAYPACHRLLLLAPLPAMLALDPLLAALRGTAFSNFCHLLRCSALPCVALCCSAPALHAQRGNQRAAAYPFRPARGSGLSSTRNRFYAQPAGLILIRAPRSLARTAGPHALGWVSVCGRPSALTGPWHTRPARRAKKRPANTCKTCLAANAQDRRTRQNRKYFDRVTG
jgi:hypothetical protein